jgi:uncharacterized tellurite resistance protein B-like protein
MFSFSQDAQAAEHEMRAILFVLLAFGHIDGTFDASERELVLEILRELLDLRAAQLFGADEATKSNAVPAWSAHFQRTMLGMEHEIKSWFTESVAQGESAAQFVRARLKLRCYELLERLDEQNRVRLLAMVERLMHADRVVHPAEVAFRDDLEALLGEPPTRLGIPSLAAFRTNLVVDEPRSLPVRRAEHPFFSGSEQAYAADVASFARQAAVDLEIIQRAEARLAAQRARGQGRLGSARSFTAFEGQEPFLDQHVAVVPPRPGVAYELLVLGDLHGCYSCLKAALLQADFFGKLEAFRADPARAPHPLLVFLGDYIDRGRYGYDGILRTVLRLYLTAPEHVFVLRGNHEQYVEHGGRMFSPVWPAESLLSISPLAPRELLAAHLRLFEVLPSVLVFERMMFVHAGIPREDTVSTRLHQLSALNDPFVRYQMVWSDPSDAAFVPLELQKANARFPFGRAQFDTFMARVGCTVMFRGHEAIVEGIRRVYREPGATLFSLFSAGGRSNEDVPHDSNYREVTPMALLVQHKDGMTRVTPFPIAYERYNDPAYNAFLAERPWGPRAP